MSYQQFRSNHGAQGGLRFGSTQSRGKMPAEVNSMFSLLGLSEEDVAGIMSMASSWVFETEETWSAATPSATSMVASLVNIITDIQSMDGSLIRFMTPLAKNYSRMKDVKKRIGFRDLGASTRDRVEALLLAMPVSELDYIHKDGLMMLLDSHVPKDKGVHFIIDRLLPDRAI